MVDLSSLLNPELFFGAGGTGVLGFVTGHLKSRGGKIAQMEQEIAECRARDARFVVIEAGFRMVVGEMQREHPESVALQMCGDLLNRKLGPAPSIGDLNDLMTKLDEIQGTNDGND